MKKYNLVIDIGNTHIVLGIYENYTLLHSWRLRTDQLRTEDEYFSILKTLAQNNKIDLQNIAICSLSSVVPNLTRSFNHLVNKYFKTEIIIADGNLDLGLSFPIKNPEFIGADLIVNAFAAKEKYKKNCIICDFGTATTIQFAGKDGYFFGTIIAPGVSTSASKLFEKASLLSNIELSSPEKLLGTTTKEALLSGIVRGNALMIDGFINEIKNEYKNYTDIISIATGGLSKLIGNSSKEIDIVDPTLTLDGLNRICELKKR
jgi:type III pantothenate kinase